MMLKQRIWMMTLMLSVVLTTLADNVRFYDAEQLSSNLITGICQDQNGYVWIGTEYGLNKFDGVRFIKYYNDEDNPMSLGDNIIRRLLLSKKGELWIVTNRGVQRYLSNKDHFETVHFGDELTANVDNIAETPDDHIWLLDIAHGLMEVDEQQMAIRTKDNLNKLINLEQVGRIFVDHHYRLWICYKDEGLLMIDTKTGKTRHFTTEQLHDKRVVDLLEDNQGMLTLLTYSAVLRLDEKTMELTPVAEFPTESSVHRLYKNHRGEFLVGSSSNGIYQIDFQAKTLKPVLAAHFNGTEVHQQKVHAYLEDKDGNSWLGCYKYGLVFMSAKPQPFRQIPLSSMAANNGKFLRYIFADNLKRVYICQEQNGLVSINPSGEMLRQWLKGYTVVNAYQDKVGRYWAGTYRNGACRIDEQSGNPTWISSLATKRVKSITEDKDGNIYMAVFNDGLHSYRPDNLEERVLGKGKLELHNRFLNTLFTDTKGMIWIGHYYGIDVYNPKTDQLVDVGVNDTLRPAITYVITETKDGAIWVGTNKGLFCYDSHHRWHRYTVKDGLANENVCGIVEAPDGYLWISTYRGLSRFSRQDGSFVNFYQGYGLDTKTYERGICTLSGKGEVIFGSEKSMLYFKSETIGKEDFKRGLTLTGIWLNGESVNISSLSNGSAIIEKPIETIDEMTFSYYDNTFTLQFSPLDFREAENVSYEYRFKDEPEGTWHQTPIGSAEITFTHLSAGRHQLMVRACDNGVYSPVKTLTIRILPPWYRSPGAYVFYFLILAAIGLLWWRNYWNKRQAEVNEEKIKFFVDISHELRSPLTLIKSPLDQLLKTSHEASSVRALRNIERNTNRLLTLTNQILSIRKIEKGQMTMRFAETPLGEFVSDICHDYDYQVDRRQLKLTFTNEADDMKVWIDRDHFDKVVTNLINNAIKYVSDGGEINVIVRHSADGQAELVVRDNGTGIDESQLRKIFERFYQASARPAVGQMSYGIGLNLTQKIVRMHHGTIAAHNRTDVEHGSEFIVRLPLGNQHLPHEQLVDKDYFATASATTDEKPSALTTDAGKSRRARRKTTYHIAVVDDDEDIRQFLQTELGDTYHVHAYADGQKALEGIADIVPDLVVSDVVMPHMDGIELLKRIKSSTKTSHIPVILLTTKTDHMSRVEGLDQGADAYVDKPFNLEELEARIASLIANRIRVRGKFTGVQEQEETVRKIELKGNDAALMEKIMKAVNDRLDDDTFNVEALADEVGLSRVQLHRRMKELTGITVGEFIRNLRLQQAAKLLATGDTSVAQVTYAVGFSNPNHFTTAFKRHFGVTPSEYMAKAEREQARQNVNHKEKNFEV